MSVPAAGPGFTSARIRNYHHRIILQRLRRLGEASRADLARAVHLTNTAIGQIVNDLQALGLVSVVGKRYEGQRGQPATILRLEPNGACGIGVRIDRHRIETALANMTGELIAHRSHAMTLPPPADALALVRADVAELLEIADRHSPGRVMGIGLAMPYHLDVWLDRLGLDNPDLRAWGRYDFAEALRQATGVEVYEENDGTAAAIAELFHGVGRDYDDFVYFFVGPAVGGGIILHGDYWRGATGNAGDVAMLPVAASRLCSAPPAKDGRDILLARASLAALGRHLAWNGAPVTSLEMLPQAMAARPQATSEWMDDCVEALVGPVASAKMFLDVPEIVIDGDLGLDVMQELIRRLETALASAMPEACAAPRLHHGSFGSRAHSLGAASLPLLIDFAPRAAVEANARPIKGGSDVQVA